MTPVIVDTSVITKWFHAEHEAEVHEARAILEAHRKERVSAHMLDLTLYEVGNVLLRALHWSATDTANQIDDLLTICGPPLASSAAWLRTAAEMAEAHGLTFYDATFAAAARSVKAPLVSADKQLLATGLAESPTAIATRLGLLERP